MASKVQTMEMSFGTPAYDEAELEAFASLPELSGASARLSVTISKGPDGDIVRHIIIADGQLVSNGPDAIEDVDAELIVKWSDAIALLDGSARFAVLYMRGKIKLAGDMAPPVLDLAPLFASEPFDEARKALAGAAL